MVSTCGRCVSEIEENLAVDNEAPECEQATSPGQCLFLASLMLPLPLIRATLLSPTQLPSLPPP